jgi:nucleotide-binding universal stress UspA family protein
MAAKNVYLVPIDFSPGSDRALDYALKLMSENKENKAKLIALHVVPTEMLYTAIDARFDLSSLLERDARAAFVKLAKRKRLNPSDCSFAVARGTNFGEIIARQAKKLGATMIVMGSHGRTGFQRFFLGSVAEKTLRHADCPVLIVKK